MHLHTFRAENSERGNIVLRGAAQAEAAHGRKRAGNRLLRLALLLLAVSLAIPAAADKAKSFFNQGRDAEARQNYEAAYDFFRQAYDLKPKDVRYRLAYERARFLASASHVHRGQLLRESGKLEEALAEFQKAAQIDASSFIALQEMKRTRNEIEAAKAPPGQAAVSPPSAMRQRMEEAAGPVELAPISELPITLKVTEDSKVIYETIGKLAGINVLFDPDYTSRRIKIELNGVTLEEALQITALESKTFWRPVTPNTIFIASDTKAKRTELEQNVVKTFYLSNLAEAAQLQEVVNTLRQILEITRVQQLPAQGAIVVRGTPDQVTLAEKIVSDIDKAKPEVVVDVAVMQVRRDLMREMGIKPPTSASIQLQQPTTTTTTTTTTGTTTPTTTAGNITLNKLANLNATDFTVNIPAATATFLLNDSTTKLIQNPQIRALDGVKASLKIGDRVPVATGSFQPGIGGVGINPLVNTQFQYIDVGVNIDITPRVHAAREVSLKVMIDISSVTSRVTIGGIDQPVIGQRKIEHEIRLKEGEVNLLGGILEEQDVRSVSGFPGLARVPILKYLFSDNTRTRAENEIVFVLVPHIVRAQDVTALNLRSLDVGTGSAIDLRRGTKPAAPPGGAAPQQGMPGMTGPAANPPAAGRGGVPAVITPAPQPPQGAPGAPTQPPIVTPTPSGPVGAAALGFDPPTMTQAAGSTFMVNVVMSGAQNVYSVPLQITYDPKLLQLVNVSNGDFLSRDGQAVALVHRDDPATGTLQITATRPPGASGVNGQGAVFTLTFLSKGTGQAMLAITRAGARDPGLQPIAVTGAQATITIK